MGKNSVTERGRSGQLGGNLAEQTEMQNNSLMLVLGMWSEHTNAVLPKSNVTCTN